MSEACKHKFRAFFGHFSPIWSALLFGDAVQCSPATIFWPNLKATPVVRPILVLSPFLLCRHSAGLGSWNPNSPFVLFGRQNGPFCTPKTLRFKGKISNFDAHNFIKWSKKCQKGPWKGRHANPDMVRFTACECLQACFRHSRF